MPLRTCPGCGDYFAGDAPPFCPADGTPLADVDPRGGGLEEGARVVEEKARLARRRVRRLKLRRVLMALTTVVVMTMVVFVVVANYVVYLKPDPEAEALLAAVTPTPSPPPPTPVPLPRCTDEDRRAARELIVRENRARWEEAIAAEAPEIVERHVPPVLTPRGEHEGKGGEAEPSRPEYRVTVTKDCQGASVTARYRWRVRWDSGLGRESGEETIEGAKNLRCSKDGGAWHCP